MVVALDPERTAFQPLQIVFGQQSTQLHPLFPHAVCHSFIHLVMQRPEAYKVRFVLCEQRIEFVIPKNHFCTCSTDQVEALLSASRTLRPIKDVPQEDDACTIGHAQSLRYQLVTTMNVADEERLLHGDLVVTVAEDLRKKTSQDQEPDNTHHVCLLGNLSLFHLDGQTSVEAAENPPLHTRVGSSGLELSSQVHGGGGELTELKVLVGLLLRQRNRAEAVPCLRPVAVRNSADGLIPREKDTTAIATTEPTAMANHIILAVIAVTLTLAKDLPLTLLEQGRVGVQAGAVLVLLSQGKLSAGYATMPALKHEASSAVVGAECLNVDVVPVKVAPLTSGGTPPPQVGGAFHANGIQVIAQYRDTDDVAGVDAHDWIRGLTRLLADDVGVDITMGNAVHVALPSPPSALGALIRRVLANTRVGEAGNAQGNLLILSGGVGVNKVLEGGLSPEASSLADAKGDKATNDHQGSNCKHDDGVAIVVHTNLGGGDGRSLVGGHEVVYRVGKDDNADEDGEDNKGNSHGRLLDACLRNCRTFWNTMSHPNGQSFTFKGGGLKRTRVWVV